MHHVSINLRREILTDSCNLRVYKQFSLKECVRPRDGGTRRSAALLKRCWASCKSVAKHCVKGLPLGGQVRVTVGGTLMWLAASKTLL